MKILVLTPMEAEECNFNNALLDCAKLNPLKHTYKVVRARVGKVNSAVATAFALSADKYDMVVVVGYAAGSGLLNVGDIVSPSAARYHDSVVPDNLSCVEFLSKEYKLLGKDDITVFTGDSFVNAGMIGDILKRFDTQKGIFDMEIGAICQVCDTFGSVPILALKVISDVPERGDSAVSFDEFVERNSDFTPFVKIIENR